MSEIALTAEHVIVVGPGRLIADTSVAEIVAQDHLAQLAIGVLGVMIISSSTPPG